MSPWEAKQYMKLYNIASVQKTISYDAKHGVSREEILSFIEILSTHPTYRYLQKNKLAMEKLEAIKSFVRLQIN